MKLESPKRSKKICLFSPSSRVVLAELVGVEGDGVLRVAEGHLLAVGQARAARGAQLGRVAQAPPEAVRAGWRVKRPFLVS